MKLSLNQKILTGFALTVAIFLFFSILIFVKMSNSISDSRLLKESDAVLAQLEEINSRILELENATKGFVLTRNLDYKIQFDLALRGLDANIESFVNRLEKQPAKRSKAKLLQGLVKHKTELSELVMNYAQNNKIPQARQLVNAPGGKLIQNKIRQTVKQIQANERIFVNTANNNLIENAKFTFDLFLILSILVFSILGAIYYFLFNELEYRRKTEQEIKSLNDELYGNVLLLEQLNKKKEEQYQIIADNSTDIISTHSLNGEYKYISPASQIVLGYSPEELIGKNPLDFIHPDDKLYAENEFTRVVKSAEIINTQLRFRKSNGDYAWLEARNKSIYNQLQQEHQIIVNWRDITLQRQLDEEVKKSREDYKTLFESIAIPILVYDDTTYQILDVNNEAIKNYGYSRAEFLKLTLKDIRIGNHVKNALKELTNLNGSTAPMIWQHLRKDQTIIQVEAKTQEVVYNNRPAKLMIANDITERIKAKEFAQTQLEYLQQLFDASPMGIVMLNPQNAVLSYNKAFEQIFEMGNLKIEGQQLASIIVPPYLKNEAKAISEACKSGELRQIITKRNTVSGKLVDVLYFEYPIFIKEKFMGAYGIYTDVSEKLVIEEQIRNQNETLLKTNAELDQFVYSTSHDLRAPLTSIQGLINLLILENDPKNFAEYLQLMEQSVKKLDGFIKDIIDYSRNSRIGLVIEKIELSELIKDIVADFSYIDDAKNIKMEIKIEKGIELFSDQDRLRMAIRNLVANAIRYHRTDQKNPYLRINAFKENNNTIITVEDNGQGIKQEYQDKIFDMFYRASQDSIGSGLGLYIVKESIDKLQGKIEVTSKPNEGSIFKISIPNKLIYETV